MKTNEILALMASGAIIKLDGEGGAKLIRDFGDVDYVALEQAGLLEGLANGSGFKISTKGQGTVKPQIGDCCILSGPNSNGATEHPAIITRVWENQNPWLVNVVCFLDFAPPTFYGSVPLFPSKMELSYPRGDKAAYLAANAQGERCR